MGIIDSLKDFMFESANSDSSPRNKALDTSSSRSRDPAQSLVRKIGLSLGGDDRDFAPPEADLEVISRAYDTESYVRQGVDKYIDKMFKAGWSLSGNNPNAVDYIKTRLAYMAEVTKLPTDKLFIEYCEDIVKFSNAVLVKARMKDPAQLPPTVSVQGIADNEPVVGYFPLNVTTLQVSRDRYGTVRRWQQEVPGGDRAVTYRPDDIIHSYYKRKKGEAFGTPFLLPVLDDIRALRQAEDDVLKMLYRNIHPFYHIKIGSEEYPADDPEIDAGKQEVEGMSVDGGLVTSERWDINAISADKVIDANPYLRYFEERVFTGLGVPGTMFGRGATANKSTSDNMDSEFVDRVKAIQRVVEADVNQFMIKELLMEGGFDAVLNPDDMVHFKFNEIDIDKQIKLENHAIYKYEHVAIDEDEMRQLIGLDVVTERSKMYTNLVEGERARLGSETSTPGNADTDNKIKPKNTKKEKNNSKNPILNLLDEHLDELETSLIEELETSGVNKDLFSMLKTETRLKASIISDAVELDVNSDNVSEEMIYDEFKELKNSIINSLSSKQDEEECAQQISVAINDCKNRMRALY